MAAGRYDITIEQGATFSLACTWKDSTGAAINLTGYTLAGKIRRKASDVNAVASFTVAVTVAASGTFSISMTAANTSLLPTSPQLTAEKQTLDLCYDIEATNGSTVYRVLEGLCKISPQVTK